ncbi:MAG: hypothetical protein ACX94A_06120 [Algiphilus sp.]
MAVGFLFAFILPIPLDKAGTGLLLPLAGIFIGLSFAWGGNTQALLQSEEIQSMAKFRDGGFVEYLYTYQAAILLILVSLLFWAVAGLGVFDKVWPTQENEGWYKMVTGVLFFFASATLRECWHVVLGSQALLLARFKISKHGADDS